MTAAADFEQYALALPDGRWLYHLPPERGQAHQLIEMRADGQTMTRWNAGSHWWATDRQAQCLTALLQPGPEIIGHRLREPDAVSERYPGELTPEQWRDRQAVGSREERDVLYELYSPLSRDQEPTEHELPSPVRVLEGCEPPGPGDPPWVASLPSSLANRPEYLHCFPGRIPGLRAHVKAQVQAMRHVAYCFDGSAGEPDGLYVGIRVPFDRPKSRWQPDRGRRGQDLKRGREVPVLAEQRMYLPVPADVVAPTYGEALAAWHQQTAFWIDIARAANVKACNGCGGRGYVLDADKHAGAP
ncbi:hypothetical protein [Streptacidiphilus sp. EB103A]|uniref:hypothetical protein n=1 Tax=Streptacidiphilus sp. EB103A TaxID=3156275 RepID=UPI003515787E